MKNNQALSWSYSRATLLFYCQKKYFFNYYNNALKYFDRDFYQEVLLLKNLSSLNMRLGTKLHELMSDYFHNTQEKLPQKLTKNEIEILVQTIENEMDEEFTQSKTKEYHSYDKNQKF
ncbi:MAG: hypothetical protein GXP45_06505 [bacterium]|nr:hypothetical protein [bacterium]